jgi:hypothetical protein
VAFEIGSLKLIVTKRAGKTAKHMAGEEWESCVNAMPERMSVLDGFYPFVALLLPACLSFSKPHHLTQRFSINCCIFL